MCVLCSLPTTNAAKTCRKNGTKTSVPQMGIFLEAGPLNVFVSNHLIPEDFEFTSADEPSFISGDQAVRIQKGAEVRLRIVGSRVDATEIVSISTWHCGSLCTCVPEVQKLVIAARHPRHCTRGLDTSAWLPNSLVSFLCSFAWAR